MNTNQRGLLMVVSSPSGAGKTTLCRRLMAEHPSLKFSVSFTTRKRRLNETDGVDYHFVDRVTFDEMVATDQFAEWAQVHDNRYGTSKQTIGENIDAGSDVLFDIDWQGATQLKSKYPDETVMIFILPPSMEALAQRLAQRGTDSPEMVSRRLAKATEELGHYGEYDFLLTNDVLQTAYAELQSIYLAAHCTRRRRAYQALSLIEASRVQVAPSGVGII